MSGHLASGLSASLQKPVVLNLSAIPFLRLRPVVLCGLCFLIKCTSAWGEVPSCGQKAKQRRPGYMRAWLIPCQMESPRPQWPHNDLESWQKGRMESFVSAHPSSKAHLLLFLSGLIWGDVYLRALTLCLPLRWCPDLLLKQTLPELGQHASTKPGGGDKAEESWIPALTVLML